MMIYISYFKIRFLNEIQYKVAALAGILTQFFWGAMYIMLYTTFINSNIGASDITVSQISTYIWLQQAFLMIFMMWSMDTDILELSVSGNIAYELTRPIDIYKMWYAKAAGSRLAKVTLRAIPLFVICVFLPQGFNLGLPVSLGAFILSLITIGLAFLLVVSYIVIVYVVSMKTISYFGTRLVFCLASEFLSGGVIPIPLMPDTFANIIKVTPFYYMQNVPFNIYNGYMGDIKEIVIYILMQILWIGIMVLIGKTIMKNNLKKVVIQGG